MKKIILFDAGASLHVNVPTEWVMQAFTHGGLGELPGDAVTLDLQNEPAQRLEVSRSMPFDRAVANMVRNRRREEFAVHWLTALANGGETDATAYELLREHAFRAQTGQVLATPDVLPADRLFRNAWRLAGDRVREDIDAARAIFARNFINWKLASLKTLEEKLEVNVLLGTLDAGLEAQVEAFRTINLRAIGDQVIAARDTADLKALMPAGMHG